MQLTRMPRGASSWARALVRPTSAVLDTAYMPSGAPGPKAVMLDTNTIDPPCGGTWGRIRPHSDGLMPFSATWAAKAARAVKRCKKYAADLKSTLYSGIPLGVGISKEAGKEA